MYGTVLLPTDGSEATTDAAAHAFDHADRCDATLHVLSVVELSSGPGRAGRDQAAIDRRRAERTETAERLLEDAPETVDATVAVEFGSPAVVVADHATDVAADLVVVSTRARSGAGRLVSGSVTEAVIESGDVPVLAVQR
jgi:nucleotide-binding universal stress UspA family protein